MLRNRFYRNSYGEIDEETEGKESEDPMMNYKAKQGEYGAIANAEETCVLVQIGDMDGAPQARAVLTPSQARHLMKLIDKALGSISEKQE